MDPKSAISYAEDMIRVLREQTDVKKLTHLSENAKSLHSSLLSEFHSSQTAASDYQKKIDDCKSKIDAAKSEVVSDEELDLLKNELAEEIRKEQMLREELRVIVDNINELDQQRRTIEEENRRVKKIEEGEEKEQRKLSFYASVTKIIPDIESQSKISGHLVDRDKKAVEKFEFDPEMENEFDICNKAWKMINQ